MRAFADADIRHLWMLHRLGRLHLEAFRPFLDSKPSPSEFKEGMAALLPEVYDYAWVLTANKDVGICFGIDCWRFIELGDIVWFPWATNRNRVETATQLCYFLGQDKATLFFMRPDMKFFGDYLCRLGIARRIGTAESLDGARLFEARRLKS